MKNSAYKSYCCFNMDAFLFKKFKFLQNQLISQLRILSKGATLTCQVN